MHGIKVLMAKNYMDNLGEEASRGLRAKAEEGIWPFFAPIGCCNVLQPGGKRTIEPDPERAGLVVNLFEWYATCRYSILEVAMLGRQAGLAFRKTGTPVRTPTVHHILRTPIYAGDLEWNGLTYHGVYSR